MIRRQHTCGIAAGVIFGVCTVALLYVILTSFLNSHKINTVSTIHYSFQLPISKHYTQNDGSGYWMKENYLVGGVRRLQADRDFEMREMLAAEDPEGLINNILSQEQRLTELKKSDNGTPAFSIETTNAQAQQIYHMFVIVNHGTIFDFWMRTDVFSEADIRVFQKSLVIGSERGDQQQFYVLYRLPAGHDQGWYLSAEHWCILLVFVGRHPGRGGPAGYGHHCTSGPAQRETPFPFVVSRWLTLGRHLRNPGLYKFLFPLGGASI